MKGKINFFIFRVPSKMSKLIENDGKALFKLDLTKIDQKTII